MNAKVIFSKTLQGESQISNYLNEIIMRKDAKELSFLIYQGFEG